MGKFYASFKKAKGDQTEKQYKNKQEKEGDVHIS